MIARRLPAQLQNVEADITVGEADEAAVDIDVVDLRSSAGRGLAPG